MYRQHFGLIERPFTLTPDTGFFFGYGSHQEALNVLLVALRSGEGFVKVTGEVGTGKTLICRMLLGYLGPEFVTAYIPNPALTPRALHLSLAEELGLTRNLNMGQHGILRAINDALTGLSAEGRRVVLLLDEAQALTDESLEALRLLTNLETEKSKLLQIVLLGQPELDERLQAAHLRQLRQRITFSYRLQPLDSEGVGGYVKHRLAVAGADGNALFARAATRLLYKASGGIPRLVNVLAHKALLSAWGQGACQVKCHHVRRAIDDTESVAPARSFRRRLGYALTGIATAFGAGLGFVIWSNAL